MITETFPYMLQHITIYYLDLSSREEKETRKRRQDIFPMILYIQKQYTQFGCNGSVLGYMTSLKSLKINLLSKKGLENKTKHCNKMTFTAFNVGGFIVRYLQTSDKGSLEHHGN